MAWSDRKIALVAPLALAMPLLMGMRGCGEDVPLGEDCSAADACGPALGAPQIACWDGSVGGNTGTCVAAADGTCHWELRDCPPPPDCTDAECGPAPLTPLPTRCERDVDMVCRWVIDDPGACSANECGPAPGTPTWTCPDGTVGGFTGRCERDADGTCGWEIVECPMTGECTIEECGPAPGAPACTCVDGSIGCNTGRCLRDPTTASCGWEWRECPSVVVCGGLTETPVVCGEGSFCAYAPEDICGAADATGTCQRRPAASECEVLDSAPVCGCDGVSYQNECFAWAAGTSAASSGACAHDCDVRDVSCDVIPPTCASGEVPTQSGACYGPCVPVASCRAMACVADSDCPDAAVWSCVSGTCVAR